MRLKLEISQMRKLTLLFISFILEFTFCTNISAQQTGAFADFDGSIITLPALKFNEKIYKNLKLKYVQDLEFEYQSHDGEIISNQKTNSVFDGEKITINLVKTGESIYSNLILTPNSNGRFNAQSANTPLLTENLSTLNRDTSTWIAYKEVRNPEIKKVNKNDFNQGDNTYTAIAYLDIDLDGDDDIFVGTLWWENPYLQENVKKIPAEIYINNGDGSYTYDMSMIDGTIPSFVHPRKVIVADFNADLRPDIFVADHGFDASPFPGESPWSILSNIDGTYSTRYLNQHRGFYHSASAGDLDGDGDIDVFVTGFSLLILLNDGNGNFIDGTSTFPDQLSSIGRLNTSEIYDVNRDGYPDILAGCECLTDSSAKIWLGPDYTEVINVRRNEPFTTIVDILPIDMDADKDIEILFSLTGSGSKNYQGAMVELATLNKESNKLSYEILYEDDSSDSKLWIFWLKTLDHDGDGDLDILVDNKSQGLVIEQISEGAYQVITANNKNW